MNAVVLGLLACSLFLLVQAQKPLNPKNCQAEVYGCNTQICNEKKECSVTRKELDHFFANCRSLSTWGQCKNETLIRCSPRAKKLVKATVDKTLDALWDHCDKYLCHSGVEKCFGVMKITRNRKTKKLTPKSLARLCEAKDYFESCRKDMEETQQVFGCPGANSTKTPLYETYYQLIMDGCSGEPDTDTDDKEVPPVDENEQQCLEKAKACSQLCSVKNGSCKMESTLFIERLDNCRSVLDFDTCVDRVEAADCPENSQAIASLRKVVIDDWYRDCDKQLCAGGVEQCFGDLKNLTVVQGEEKLTRAEKKLLCERGVGIKDCWETLDDTQDKYGCRGNESASTPLFREFMDFINRKCKDGDYVFDIPPKSDYECREEAEACSRLCDNGFCYLGYENILQYTRDCGTLSEWKRCVDRIEDCPRNGTSIPRIREIIDIFEDACEFALCDGGVEQCFQGRTITVQTGTGEMTARSMSNLCPSVDFFEDCEAELIRTQFEFDCPGANAGSRTEAFQGYLDTLLDECDDITEVTDSLPNGEDTCLEAIESCSPYCRNRYCSFRWRSLDEMINKCSTLDEWERCLDNDIGIACPLESELLASAKEFVEAAYDLCSENVCDSSVENCFVGVTIVVVGGEISTTRNEPLCDHRQAIEKCASDLADIRADFECPADNPEQVYQDFLEDIEDICPSDGPIVDVPPTDDECREEALDYSKLCFNNTCSLTPGSRRELYQDCEKVLEWERSVNRLGAECDDDSLDDVRDIVEQFRDYCKDTICEKGIEVCFAGMTLFFEPESNELADSAMPDMCSDTPAVAECKARQDIAKNLFQCPGASTEESEDYQNYLDQLKEECQIEVEEGDNDPNVRVSCDEDSNKYLACLTCQGSSEEDCENNGQFLICEGFMEPVCEHQVQRDRGSGEITYVRRRCVEMNDCHARTYGYASLVCQRQGPNKYCRACTFQQSQCHIVDVDECALNEDDCSEFATCENTLESYTCTCMPGFGGDGTVCTDDDECAGDTNDCAENADCINQPGSYTCRCNPGYTGDGRTCSDIDECTEGGALCSSEASCRNIDGSYECECNEGFEGDGFICEDVNECENDEDNECDENADCINEEGTYACECNDGYGGTGFECEDVDECADGIHSCSPEATCTNTEGGHECQCVEGFTGNGEICEDIDECTGPVPVCGDFANCVNELGSFVCECQDGYYGDGINCTIECEPGFRDRRNQYCEDIDECMEDLDNCDSDAACTNIPGSFTCSCNQGFFGDGTYCNDEDECAAETDDCDDNAVCTNTEGSYRCTCSNGYVGDGQDCDNVNECLADPNLCGEYGTCEDTEGSFRCICDEGFELYGNDCADTNECLEETDNCAEEAVCYNNPGSYSCSCPADMYDVNGDGSECEVTQVMPDDTCT